MILFCKVWFRPIFMTTIYHKAIIFHMLIGVGGAHDPYSFWIHQIKGKGHKGHL